MINFNFDNFSKKVSNKDIVRIIKENNKQNYIIERFNIITNIYDLFYDYNTIKFSYILYNNKKYYSKDFNTLLFDKNQDIIIYFDKPLQNCYRLFSNCNFTYLDLSHLNTSNVFNMSCMFYNCKNLKEIKFGNFNTSNVTDMSYMFYTCESLKKLDLSSFNTSNVIYMNFMFSFCINLMEVNLKSFNTSKVNYMEFMFDNCNNLEKLKLKFNISKVKNMSYMFQDCKKLNIQRNGNWLIN